MNDEKLNRYIIYSKIKGYHENSTFLGFTIKSVKPNEIRKLTHDTTIELANQHGTVPENVELIVMDMDGFYNSQKEMLESLSKIKNQKEIADILKELGLLEHINEKGQGNEQGRTNENHD